MMCNVSQEAERISSIKQLPLSRIHFGGTPMMKQPRLVAVWREVGDRRICRWMPESEVKQTDRAI